VSTVTVRGSATVGATPDEALVVVELDELRPTAEQAYAAVAERAAALRSLCDELEIGTSKRSTGGISVGEHTEFVDGRAEHRGFRAVARTDLRLEDAAVVARVLAEAVARVGARVDGPFWSVRPDNAAHLSAAREAAVVARRKAEAYGEALGLRLGALEKAEEPVVRATPRPLEATTRALAAEAPVVGVEPGELQVTAEIELTFFLVPV
jgi:uncharacterized protein YggE